MDACAHFGTGDVMGRALARLVFAGLLAPAILLGAQPITSALGQSKKLTKIDKHLVALPRRDPKVNLSVNMRYGGPASQRRAILVLLPGGHGRLKIVKGKPTQLLGNFLVKQRRALVQKSFITALIDAPDDLQEAPFLFGNYRRTHAHATDVSAAVQSLRRTYGYKKPLVVIGMSSGATGAANAAHRDAVPMIKGVVLLASVTQPNQEGKPWLVDALPTDGENAVPLSGLSVPILFVHHQDDQCALSPHAGVQALVNQLMAAGRDATLVTITGGPADSNECDSGLGHHSFQGMETQTVEAIANWINVRMP
jgi:pimeloyl-ACP methyl ester carboxylesterase